MPINFSTKDVTDIFLGSKQIQKVYLGSELKYQSGPTPFPSDYSYLEYISSTSGRTQWIDLGVKASDSGASNIQMEVSFNSKPSKQNTDWYYFGTYGSSQRLRLVQHGVKSGPSIIAQFNNQWTTSSSNSGTCNTDVKYTVTLNIYIDGTAYYRDYSVYNGSTKVVSTTATTEFVLPDTTYYMFASNNGGTGPQNEKADMKCYGIVFKDRNGNIKYNFRPCKTNTGVGGLWETVRGKFYGNSGSGSFTLGPVVS